MPYSLRDYLATRAPVAPAQPAAPTQDWAAQNAAMDAENAQQARQQEATDSPFTAGLDAATSNGSLTALYGLAQGATGNIAGGRATLRRAALARQQAQDYETPETSDLATAYKSGSLGNYAAHQLGALTPGIAETVVPALVTGGVGALVQGGLRRAALGAAADAAAGSALERTGAEAVIKRTGQTLADNFTADQTANAARQTLRDTFVRRATANAPNTIGQRIGEQVGAIGSGTAQMAGTTASAIDPNATDADLQSQSRKALLAAGGLGALQAIPGIALMGRYGMGAAAETAIAKRLGAPLLQRVAREGAEQAGIGAATGAATVAATHAAHDYITGQPSAAPAVAEYINAAAAGGIGGFAFGAPAGLHGKAAPAAEVTERGPGKVSAFKQAFQEKYATWQASRPKPGEEVTPEGKPVSQAFDENLAAMKDDDPFNVTGPYGGVPFETNDSNTLGGPGKGLVDPARTAARANQYDLLFDPLDKASTKGSGATQRAFASMLGDDQWTADAVPQVKAAAQAFTQGFDGLNAKQQGHVFDFASRLEPAQRSKFLNAMETSNEIVKRSQGLKDASEVPDLRKPFMTGADGKPLTAPGTDGKSAKIPTSEVRGGSGFEPGALSETDTPNSDLNYIPDAEWKGALFTPRNGKARPSPDEENIATTQTTQNGEGEYRTDINIKRAASALAGTEEGAALLHAPGSRKVNAVLTIVAEANARGHLIDPEQIRPGLRVFPEGKGDTGVLSPAEAKTIRDSLARRAKQTQGEAPAGGKPGFGKVGADVPRAKADKSFAIEDTGDVKEAQGDTSGADTRLAGDPQKLKADQTATERTVRTDAEKLGIQGSEGSKTRTTGQLYEDALHMRDSMSKTALLTAGRKLAETDPVLASHIDAAHERHALSQFAGERITGDRGAQIPYLKALKDGRKPTSEQAAAYHAIRERTNGFEGSSEAQRKFVNDLRAQIGGNADMQPVRGDATKRTAGESQTEFDARQATAAKPKETLKTLADEAKKADNYARNPPVDFTAAEARARATRMDEVSKKAAAKAKALGTEDPAYDRVDELRMNAKDAAEALRHVADQQDAAEKANPHFDQNLHAINGSGESSASLEAINRGKDEKALGRERMLIDRDGSVRQLFGPDAVDTFARDGQVIVQHGIGKDPWTILHADPKLGEAARGKLEAARGKLAAELADSRSDAFHDENLAPGESRQPGESVRDAVERVKATPEFKAIGKMMGELKARVTTASDKVKERALVNRLTKAFGLDKLTLVEHADGEGAPAGWINGNTVSLNANLKGAARMSALLHEFGHHLFEQKFASADKETQTAIKAEYKAWLASHKVSTDALAVRASRAPFFTTDRILDALGGRNAEPMTKEQAKYLLSFHEFAADSIARALEQHGEVQSLVGKFFGKVAQLTKLTYDLLRGVDPKMADTPAAIRDWVGRLWAIQNDDVSAAERAPPEFRTAAGASPHAAFTSAADASALLHPDDRGVLRDLFTRRGTMEQLLTGADADTVDALTRSGSQLDTAINRGFALWAAGKLDLVDKSVLAPLNTMRDAIMKMFGITTQQELAERVLADLKAGRADSTRSVSRLVESDKRAALRAKVNAGSDVAKVQLAARKAITGTLKAVDSKLKPTYDRVLTDLHTRLRATNIGALHQLAEIIHTKTGEIGHGQSLTQAISQTRHQLWGRVADLTNGLDLRGQAKVIRALRTKTKLDDPALEAKRQAISDFLNKDMRAYLSKAGVDFGKIDNYYPVVVDPRRVQNREMDFKAMLSPPELEAGMRAYFKSKGWKTDDMSHLDMINAMYRMASSEFDYSTQGISFADGTTPGGPEFRTRVSEFIYRSGDQDLIDRFAKFQSGSLEQTLIPYITHAVRRAEFTRRLGQTSDMKTSAVEQLLAKAKTQGASPEQIQLARDYVDSAMGSYGTGPNPFFQKMLGAFDRVFDTKLTNIDSAQYRKMSNAIVAYQNLRVLGLGIFGNMIDPLGVWVRSSSVSQTWDGYKAAMKALSSKEGSHLSDMAHAIGAVETHAMGEALASNFGGGNSALGSFSNAVNRTLFKVNGMESITKFARLAATETGNKFLLRHATDPNAHSARYLKELGLTAADIKGDPQHPGYVKMNPKVSKALYQFVDEAVLRPAATERPLWHNDPHFAVLSQFKGYMYSFYNTIVARMLHEAGNGNMRGLMPVVGYLGVTMAAEMMRELVQYGPGGNPRRKNWGSEQYLEMVADRAGLFGPRFGAVSGALSDPQRGNLPGQSLTGPSVSQASELLKTIGGRQSVDTTLLHALPGQSIYKGWVSDAGDTSQPRQAVAVAGS